MGLEAKCGVVNYGDGTIVRADQATVLWEGDALIVRGNARINIKRGDIKSVSTSGDVLAIVHAAGRVELSLGESLAAKWKAKITSPPKSRLDKLGIGTGTKVAVMSVDDDALTSELEAVGAVVTARVTSGTQVILLGVRQVSDLARIGRVAQSMSDSAALWVIHPKGIREVGDVVIFGEAKRVGLTYTKVASFSETLTGEKLVRPLARR